MIAQFGFDDSARQTSSAGRPSRAATGADRLTRLRAWLDASLFVDHPRAPQPSPKRIATAIGLAVLGIALILLRLGWSKPLDSVWAEDGAVFLPAALDEGPLEAIGTTYADYLHVVPRLLAELVALAPLEWAPELLAVLGSAVVVLCAFVVWWTSAAHLPDPRLRGVLTAMVVLLPVVGYESLANVAYVSWFMLFASFWLLLWRPPSLIAALAGAVFIALTLMSSPLGLLLVPIAVLRTVAYRGGPDSAILGGFVIGAAVQAVAIAFDDSPSPAAADWDFELASVYLLRIVGGLILGQYGNAAAWLVAGWLWVVALIAVFGLLLAVAVFRSSAPGRALSVLAVGLSAVIFFISGYQRDLAETMMWSAGDATTAGSRHTIIPVLLLLTVVLVQLQRRPPSFSGVAWRRVRGGVLALLALVALSAFYVGNEFRFNPTWSAELERAREVCRGDPAATVDVPIAPAGWSARLSCSDVLRDR